MYAGSFTQQHVRIFHSNASMSTTVINNQRKGIHCCAVEEEALRSILRTEAYVCRLDMYEMKRNNNKTIALYGHRECFGVNGTRRNDFK